MKTRFDFEREINMSNFVLSCCTTVDLAKKHLEDRNIIISGYKFPARNENGIDEP